MRPRVSGTHTFCIGGSSTSIEQDQCTCGECMLCIHYYLSTRIRIRMCTLTSVFHMRVTNSRSSTSHISGGVQLLHVVRIQFYTGSIRAQVCTYVINFPPSGLPPLYTYGPPSSPWSGMPCTRRTGRERCRLLSACGERRFRGESRSAGDDYCYGGGMTAAMLRMLE